MRRPLIVLLGGVAILHLVLATSSAVDIIGSALGWSDSAWRSGNVAYVETTVEAGHLHIGSARMWGYITVVGAGTLQLLAGVALAVAVCILIRRGDALAVRRWARRGVAIALTVWFGLTIGDEVFIAYETGGWDKFILLAGVVITTWLAVELLPFDEQPAERRTTH